MSSNSFQYLAGGKSIRQGAIFVYIEQPFTRHQVTIVRDMVSIKYTLVILSDDEI